MGFGAGHALRGSNVTIPSTTKRPPEARTARRAAQSRRDNRPCAYGKAACFSPAKCHFQGATCFSSREHNEYWTAQCDSHGCLLASRPWIELPVDHDE